MKDMLKKLLALCLCFVMMTAFAAAEETDEWLADETVDEAALNAAESTAEEEALMAELAAMIDDPTREGEVDLSDLSINDALPDHVVNILLIGIDNRSVELESGRADANIICSINKNTGAITLTSIGRDTAVKVPGYKSRQRLNAAFKYGSNESIAHGAELAMKTINLNFQMNIERYVLVNIHGLADIIQALGGVDMYLTKEEAHQINYELFTKEPMDSNKGREKLLKQDGVQHLDGMQAVTYGRIRNLQGQNDLNRNSRQRVLLETLLKTVMQDMDVMKLMTLIQTALPYGRTNLTLDEMLSLGMAVLGGETMKKLSEGGEILQQFGIPVNKQYAYRKYGEVSLLYINPERLEKTLGDLQTMIYGESYYNPELFPD